MASKSYFTLDPLETAQKAIADGFQLPEPAPDGRINTMNNCGAMKLGNTFALTTHKFIEFASQPGKKVLDIGAAYGEACLESLRRGATDYTANDIEEKHVKILARRIYENFPEKISDVKLVVGGISDSRLDRIFEANTFDGILVDSVLHFLKPNTISKAVEQLYTWLKPGGRLFALMGTYYHSTIRKEVREEFDRQTQEFIKHPSPDVSKIPGFMENSYDVMDFDHAPKEEMEKKYALRISSYLAFNQETAKFLFEKAGFLIEECVYTEIPTYPYHLDGRERVAVIAKKPENA